MLFLIGSRAVKLPGYRTTDKSDYDIVYTDNPPKMECRAEMFHIDKNPAMHMLSQYVEDSTVECGQTFLIPSAEALYTIKISHSFWDIKWDKTMWDISFFQSNDIKIIPEFYKALYKGWEQIRGRKPANLNKSNDDFFTATVDRKYNHDDLHRATCYYDRPIYELCKYDLSMAKIDKDLFDRLDLDKKIKMVKEEAYAIALERYMIPRDFEFNKELAYKRSLQKLVTSLSKGWFPEFIVLHWNMIKTLDYDYVKEFKKRIK